VDKAIRKLDTDIGSLHDQIQALQTRKAEAEARLESIKYEIPLTMEAMKKAMVGGGDLLTLEERRKELQADKERQEILIVGLIEKIEEFELQLSRAIEERSDRFAELVSSWLAKEVKAYNETAERLTQSIKRLSACHSLLKETGRTEPFQEALGNAWRYFRQTRIVELGNGFQPSDLEGRNYITKLQPGRELCERVFNEVVS
jgi:chromosome segregation ATPase